MRKRIFLRILSLALLVGGSVGALAQVASVGQNYEIGDNDFRITNVGTDGNPLDWVKGPAAFAYNSTDNEYFLVWTATYGQLDEIYGQRINAATKEKIGDSVRLSNMGTNDATTTFYGREPAIAYNSTDNEYLVVWHGRDNHNPATLGSTEQEIFGQRISAAGAEIGVNDFRISDMGIANDARYLARNPKIVYDRSDREYLIVWIGNDASQVLGLDVDDYEVFGQRVRADGSEAGSNDFLVSSLYLSNGRAITANLVYNSVNKDYLVCFWGVSPPLNSTNSAFYLQRLDGLGSDIGTEFAIKSVTSPVEIEDPYLAYNPSKNEYLFVWLSDDTPLAPTLVDNEFEVFGQRLTDTGAGIGDPFRISDMGADGNPADDANSLTASYNSSDEEYLVVWSGRQNTIATLDGEHEIYGQRIDAESGAEIGINDFRISDMGTDGDEDFDANSPSAFYSPTTREYLVLWTGDEDIPPLVNNEREVFGQFLTGGFCGNGSVDDELAEECDDGNMVSGDGCSEQCDIETTPNPTPVPTPTPTPAPVPTPTPSPAGGSGGCSLQVR